LNHLLSLNLTRVGLEQIKVGAFEGLLQLNSLDLSYNRLRQLDKGVFDPLSKLVHLNISNNQLADLQPGLFSNIKNLKNLLLDNNNQLNEKSLEAFMGLKNLKCLSINFTPLEQNSYKLRNFVGRKCKINDAEDISFVAELILIFVLSFVVFFSFNFIFEWFLFYFSLTQFRLSETSQTIRFFLHFSFCAFFLFLVCLEELGILKKYSSGPIVIFVTLLITLSWILFLYFI
jgi:hypothetical protein